MLACFSWLCPPPSVNQVHFFAAVTLIQVGAASERAGCTASLARSFLCLLLGIGTVPVQSKPDE